MKKLITMVFTLVFLLGVSSIGNPVNTKTDYWESFQTQLEFILKGPNSSRIWR